MSEKELTLFTELVIVWLERNGMEDANVSAAIDAIAERTAVVPTPDDRATITARVLSRVA
jgi:hypothetical protein